MLLKNIKVVVTSSVAKVQIECNWKRSISAIPIAVMRVFKCKYHSINNIDQCNSVQTPFLIFQIK